MSGTLIIVNLFQRIFPLWYNVEIVIKARITSVFKDNSVKSKFVCVTLGLGTDKAPGPRLLLAAWGMEGRGRSTGAYLLRILNVDSAFKSHLR